MPKIMSTVHVLIMHSCSLYKNVCGTAVRVNGSKDSPMVWKKKRGLGGKRLVDIEHLREPKVYTDRDSLIYTKRNDKND